MVKAVIFDMDGVLIDSEPIYMYQTVDFLAKHGVTISEEDKLKLPGSSNELSWELLAALWHEEIAPEELECYSQQFVEEHGEEKIIYSELLNPYVRYLLPRLKEAGLKLAIASSSPLESITEMVEECGIQHHFDLFVSGRDFAASKPDPAIYLSTMERLQLGPDDCLIVEDSNYGIEAGKRAGARVIALRDERFYKDQSASDFLVHDLFEAYRLIMEIKGAEEHV